MCTLTSLKVQRIKQRGEHVDSTLLSKYVQCHVTSTVDYQRTQHLNC